MRQSCLGGWFPTSAEKSPLVSLMLLPAFIASGIFSAMANIRSSPIAVRTEPSMMPSGGTMNPATMRTRLTMKLRWKIFMGRFHCGWVLVGAIVAGLLAIKPAEREDGRSAPEGAAPRPCGDYQLPLSSGRVMTFLSSMYL